MGHRYKKRIEELRSAVISSKSMAGTLRIPGLRAAGGNYATIRGAIREHGIETSHWTGQGHRRGSTSPVVGRRPLHQILIRGSSYATSRLHKRLVQEGLLEKRCHSCRLDSWLGQTIPLELDHIDGDRLEVRAD